MNARHGDPTPEGVNTLHVALGYIAKHKGKRFIFPLAPGRKGRPLIKDNLTRACNDPDQIERWHDRWPGCAWGCACKKSGIVCVDIDAGNDKQGMKSVHALKTAGFTFPNTEKERSPSGGWHLIYTGEHHFSASKIGLHVDTPNYFLFGGNVRHDGKPYVVIDSPATAPLPYWINEKITPRADRPRRESSRQPIPLDLFKRMLAVTPYTEGPGELDNRRSYEGWLGFAMACHEAAGGDESEYLGTFIEWCLNDPMAAEKGWTTEQIERHWQSFTADPPEGQRAVSRASSFKVLSHFGHGDLVGLAADMEAFQADPWDGEISPQARARRNDRRGHARHQRMAGFR